MELSRKRLTRNKNKREQRRTGGGGVRLGHYIHHRNCHWHKSLLACRRQRMISFCGKLVEIKDLICGSQKLVNDIYILHIVQYIVLSRKIHSILNYQNICHHHVKFSLKTRIWMSQDFKQFYDNRKIWNSSERSYDNFWFYDKS